MDRPPSFPHYKNPNPNFLHHYPPPNSNPNFFFRPPPPPLQNPNTYSNPPFPPPVRELSGTLSSLQSLLSECQNTLASLSQNLALDHSSLLQKDDNNGFVRCPFDSNHLMPPEALFLHSLRCPNHIDLTHLLESFSNYRKTLELPCELQFNKDDCDDLCFSLDNFADFGNNFFYRDCPGAVNFSELDGKSRILTLPNVLSMECDGSIDSDENLKKHVLGKSLAVLPSDFCGMKSEIYQWRNFPSSYSFSVLNSICGSEASHLSRWILVNSTRYGVIIDTYMRDHILFLFRLCMKSVVNEACGLVESDKEQNMSCKSRTYECPVLIQVFSWLASQFAVLYGEGNGKFFALDMFKECIVESASQIMLFRSEKTRPKSSGVHGDLSDAEFSNMSVEVNNPFEKKSGGEVGKALDSSQAISPISVSRVAAAVAALYERSMLERRMRAIRYPQSLTRNQRVAELGFLTVKADEERKRRPSYRPIIDHAGLARQRSSNQDMNKMKTREELLAEERDYKRRRMSYRGKKVKRTPREVLRDMIEEFTEEMKLAGDIGCLHSLSDQKEGDFGNNTASSTLPDASPRLYKEWKGQNRADIEYSIDTRTHSDKGKRYEEYDSGRQESHRSYKHSDQRNDEFTRIKRHSHERKSYHQSHKSSHEKKSSSYKSKRDDDPYDRRRRESRNQNSFEDRYNPKERE